MTAFHEASHAVVAMHLGCVVRRVELHSSGRGLTVYRWRTSTPQDDQDFVNAQVALAGTLGELMFRGSRGAPPTRRRPSR